MGWRKTWRREDNPREVLDLMKTYHISARLTFSNSMLEEEHLSDPKCNTLCRLFNEAGNNGVIVHSDLLLHYLMEKYPNLYFVFLPLKSSLTLMSLKKNAKEKSSAMLCLISA